MPLVVVVELVDFTQRIQMSQHPLEHPQLQHQYKLTQLLLVLVEKVVDQQLLMLEEQMEEILFLTV